MMTSAQVVSNLKVLAQTLLPLAPPGVSLAITLALNAMTAVQAAQNQGKDVTREQLDALFAADDLAKQDDLLAQSQVALNSSPKP
jgi:hypothetical protein